MVARSVAMFGSSGANRGGRACNLLRALLGVGWRRMWGVSLTHHILFCGIHRLGFRWRAIAQVRFDHTVIRCGDTTAAVEVFANVSAVT